MQDIDDYSKKRVVSKNSNGIMCYYKISDPNSAMNEFIKNI